MKQKNVLVKYSENNSGGYWWLNKETYEKLYQNGWEPEYYGSSSLRTENGFNRPYQITKPFPTEAMGIAEWEWITGENADTLGCTCCGQPHNFYTSEIEE